MKRLISRIKLAIGKISFKNYKNLRSINKTSRNERKNTHLMAKLMKSDLYQIND